MDGLTVARDRASPDPATITDLDPPNSDDASPPLTFTTDVVHSQPANGFGFRHSNSCGEYNINLINPCTRLLSCTIVGYLNVFYKYLNFKLKYAIN